ncbi:CpsD/CapB family tyrosine-protein kinase [Nevskia soli]|uniref:CpsD/CapB family tyrosine-protein kinase n=1 Tax=Nevskia soli TaxID=418856 RepID=UPI0004A77868|nr:CpsD/CapB family tyrosine-protein kinase [Nevskia soli]
MSSSTDSSHHVSVDSGLRAALIRRRRLTSDSLARITDTERRLGLPFCDAALCLGLVSRDDIEAAQNGGHNAGLAKVMAQPDSRLSIVHDPYAVRSETVRALRTELILRSQSNAQANMIAILSPCAGEGRSMLAAELAISFSQLGRATLLVDADLRSSRQHSLFAADNQCGLADAIVSGQPPCMLSVEGVQHLSLLTSGESHSNPLELLSDARFELLIEEWRRQFAYVVFDTGPVSLYSDGLAVAKSAGRVLALSRAGHTPYSDTRDLLRRLEATRSQILGAVINHF